ncbi:hypothetical protein JQ634_00945 [Bradyrhizobium sp. AUGA SZCCT0240]|uniref:hypothetical protein n=1 Tax=Bradyrhizobium sp. AUGA SZCCT0240 TaxID=2807669 RepID=UPI001BA4A7A2|nr:hypothetical protein [Bradyrhizobium sp. AUGA SZCCT0240]MBR1252264.1 hypothetical protein [Bradyrhizobium sp. AUGA SZCCT0240]
MRCAEGILFALDRESRVAGPGESDLTIYEYEIPGGGASLKVTAVGPKPVSLQSGVFTVTAITIDIKAGGNSSGTTLLVQQTTAIGVDVPVKLLVDAGGGKLRLRTLNDLQGIAAEEWAALKDKVRRRLADPILLQIGGPQTGTVFGIATIAGQIVDARIWLNPRLVEGFDAIGDKDWVLRVDAGGAVNFTYRQSTNALQLNGRLRLAFEVRKVGVADWIDLGFDFDLPRLPGFDLKLPRIKLRTLDLTFVQVPFDHLLPSFFTLSLPPFIDKLKFEWDTNPDLMVQLTQGDLTVATVRPGTGSLTYDTSKVLVLKDVALGQTAGKFDFAATIEPQINPITISAAKFAPPYLPFQIEAVNPITLEPVFAKLDLGNGKFLESANLTLKLSCTKLVIAAKDDPSTSIALHVVVELNHDFGSGKTSTTLAELKIVEPYPIDLIVAGAKQLGELVRLIAAIPVPQVGAPDASGILMILERLAKLLAAAAKWLAKQAGEAIGLLAGLVEAVLEAILQLLKELARLGADATKEIISHIAIEVRLEPKSYRLRQIVIMPVRDDSKETADVEASALGFDFIMAASLRPALVIDLGPESWTGVVVQVKQGSHATLATDLWLEKETGPQQAITTTNPDTGAAGAAPPRLVKLVATPIDSSGATEIVLAAVQRGRLKLFQSFVGDQLAQKEIKFDGRAAVAIRETGLLRDGALQFNGDAVVGAIVNLELKAEGLQDRLLSLFAKAEAPGQGGNGGFLDQLKQKIKIKDVSATFDTAKAAAEVALKVELHIDDKFIPETTLRVSASLRDLSMRITGGDRIVINGTDSTYHPIGLTLDIKEKKPSEPKDPQKPYPQFVFDLSHGNESLGLADEAKAELSFGKVSTSGKGLQFEVPTLRVGRAGVDLEAKVLPDPVKLGGVDVPFRFTSGQVSIKGSKFGGGSLAGAGQLPSALVGEANANIALQLGAGSGGDVIVKAATARLDKSGDPIRCTSTRFELTITELGLDYAYEGSYHFYFLVTGSAVFKPGGKEFESGLLKNLKDITIKLDKAPLAADPRVLMRSISFQVKVDPPKKISFFDIFTFNLKGFGFHPASPKFNGDPAMNISGQVSFLKSGDKTSANIEFHGLWIARPKSGSSKPRVRFDGLTVGIRTGGVDVEGTAIAVDGSMPDLYRPGVLPADITAEGFLANGKIDIDGWASMTAAMGFLELRKKGAPDPKHSFFLFGQLNKMATPIRTPVGTIYLREAGFGFGYRYTIAGINQAEKAESPQQLVKILDNVSKYQGNLHQFQAWEPTYDNCDITLALRGMFALSAIEGGSYDEKGEKDLPNPLLFDIIAAFRTDFTFLINLRAWVSVNYNDWAASGLNEPWKSNPTMRGYLYFSVPRKEFLGRFLSDGKGYVGKHPELPKRLADAIANTRFSSTLYIRPGLFHAELGWPYELGFDFGKPGDNFYLSLSGGLIHRIEDASVLNGIAFKAQGSVYLEGRVGGSSLGAAAVARVNFAIEARVLSYLSLRDFGESFYYGYMRIDIAVHVSVEVWISFKIFGKRIRLSVGFSLHLAVSIALEAVIGPGGIGGRAHVAIGVRAFGRTLSVGIGFSFNNDKLADARAKVARFMELGLATAIPDKAEDGRHIEANPKPEPSRKEVAQIGDKTIEEDIGSEAPPRDPNEDEVAYEGRPITQTDFWAILYPTTWPDGGEGDGPWYVMQLVPRDHTPLDGKDISFEKAKHEELPGTFFAAPLERALDFSGHQVVIGVDGIRIGKVRVGDTTKWESGKIIDCPTDLTAIIAEEDGKKLELGQLLGTLFVGKIKDEFDFQEPAARIVAPALGKLADSMKSSAQQLGRIGRGRTNLTGRQKREAEIEEARSAVVSAVVETSASLAAQGETNKKWPLRPPGDIDARDFDLTFVLNDDTLAELFGDATLAEKSPPLGKLAVIKSDVVTGIAPPPAGKVYLFNHPSRMFRNRQPKFSPTHVIEAQGVKLNWDLEPAWGTSVGAYHDPEFHLKHYRIRRTIRGIPGNDYSAEFLVKPASAIEYMTTADHEPSRVRLLRPEFQFIDDFRSQAAGTPAQRMPDVLRLFLLNQATTGHLDDLEKEVGVGTIKGLTEVRVVYEIVPVDNAGTSDFGEVYTVGDFEVRETRPISPREMALQISYPSMPSHVETEKGEAAPAPDLLLMTKPALIKEKDGAEKPDWPGANKETENHLYLLRIQRLKVAPSGGYGADAIDDGRRRPDSAAIERMRPEEVDDFLLQVSSKKPIMKLIAEHQPDIGVPVVIPYGMSVFVLKDGQAEIDLGTATPGTMNELLAALGVANKPAQEAGNGHRVFVARVYRDGSKARLDRRGEWKTVAFNLVIGSGPKPAISSVVEVLEQPVQLEFAALKRQDMRIESGRVELVQPTSSGGLTALLEHGARAFEVVRDARRRTAMRLQWNARPTALELSGTKPTAPKELYRWISGYEVFSVDPDILTARGPDLIDEVEKLAQPLGRVSLLPATMRGLDPAGFGDFGRIESAYPSDTLRLKFAPSSGSAGGVRKAGWYSASETAAVFPQPSIRRSLMPDPDEGLVAALFAGGKPDAIRVSLPDWDEKNPDWDKKTLEGWTIEEWRRGARGWGEYDKARHRFEDIGPGKAIKQPGKPLKPFSVALSCFSEEEKAGFDVAALRRLLQNLRLAPTEATAKASETAAVARRMAQPDYLSKVTLRLEAIRFVGTKRDKALIVATQEANIDLMPRMHPILADTLAFIQYDTWDAAGLAGANGRLYRRYAVSRDADPDITTDEFAAYVDQTPTERDPYGWGALRALGLAAGFRLFDTDTNDYVRFGQDKNDLGQRINAAFARALERYDDGSRDNGQPFVDILTQTWGNVKLSWFDGGRRNPTGEEEIREIESEMLAVAQIALRPHPDRLTTAAGKVSPVVRYYALTTNREEAGRPEWKLEIVAGSRQLVRFDVLSVVGGIVAQKPVRLDEGLPEIRLLEPWPAVPLPGNGKKVIAVIRAVTLREPAEPLLQLNVTAPEGREYTWEAVGQPVAMGGLVGNIGSRDPDLAFGKFEDLSAEDWSDALFRPNFDVSGVLGTEIEPHETLQRLAYYIGRRFAQLELPVAPGDTKNPPSADQKREAEVKRKELAERIVRFWTRFVEHCAPGWGRPFDRSKGLLDKPDAIFFSLGTIADPGQSRRAPSDTGTLSMTVVDVERRGARRKLTVRPYGRYEAWANAVKVQADPQAELNLGLQGAFDRLVDKEKDKAGTIHFVDTTLPRTEPLEKPVILSSVTHPPHGAAAGRLELVVAHGSDLVLAQANRRNAALLAPLDISVGFWREFGHMGWIDVIKELYGNDKARYGDLEFAPLAQFGSLDQRLDIKQLAVTREVAEQRLLSLRQHVPDAWLGSTMITAMHLPYFFRTHALVHASAGIVVSEQTTTTFEEGFYQLAWPFVKGGYGDRLVSAPHRYGVDRRYVPASPDPNNPTGPELPAREDTIITFHISALRFIDCMLIEDANLWFGPGGEYWEAPLKRVAHLPEPGVGYRISIETPLMVVAGSAPHEEVLARVQEIDVLASTPKGKKDPLYLLQQPGSRFELDATRHRMQLTNPEGTIFATNPEPHHDGLEWSVPVSVLLAQPSPVLLRALAADHIKPLKAVLSVLPEPKEGLPPALDGLAAVTLSWTKKPSAAQWKAVLDALDALGDSPEAIELVQVAKQHLGKDTGLSLQIGSKSAAAGSVAEALAGLGGNVSVEDIGMLVLRRAPTDTELAFFEDQGDGSPGAKLELFVRGLVEEQLFGAGRRPAVTASKGPEAPITRAFERIGA